MALVASLLVGVGPASAEELPPVVAPDAVVLAGEARVGSTLSVEPGVWVPVGTAFAYAWLADDVAIDGEVRDELVVTPDLLGRTVSVRVTGSADGHVPADKKSEGVAVRAGTLASTPVPKIMGSAKVGLRLSADVGAWDDGVSLRYQWSADRVAISGATESGFTPTASHRGAVITVDVTGTRAGYTSVTRTSIATSPVAQGDLVAGAPSFTGAARVGGTLTAKPGTWSPVPTFSYQWLVAGAPVAGATGTTFVPKAADQGKALALQVIGQRDGYESRQVTTAPVVVGAGVFATVAVPTILGTARVGTALKATTGTWDPVPTFSFQWLADSVVIRGATASTYTPQAALRGKRISVRVTGTRSGFPATSRTSSQTAATAYGIFTTAPAPTITGTPRVGTTLRATARTWSPGAALSFQWRADGAAVSGATSSWFTPQQAQRTKRVTVTVTARRDGFTTTSRTSSATAPVGWGVFTSSPVPRVSGSAAVGSSLTATPGSWAPWASLSYQWKANGITVKGATARTYKLAATDAGKRMTVTVTARRPGYANGMRTSSATPAVTKPFTRAVTPTMVGTTRVFSTLTARTGSWNPTPTYGYQWKRNGAAISGATRSTYRLVEADYGKRISVTVTARRGGYTTASRTSASTATVAGPAATLKGNGTYRVGQSLGAGTYWAPGGSGCYWERRSDAGSDFAGIIANDFSLGGRRIVTISAGDAYFKTEDCGGWTRLAKIGTPGTTFTDGAQRVGIHIRPGLYYAPGGDGCYWEALAGFSGRFADLIENDYSDYTSQYVQIDSSVIGFDAHNCGTWRRVGN